jgi:DNA-binding CsgD family transcriptional regulator
MNTIDWLWKLNYRTPVLLTSGALLLLIAILDWMIKPYYALGFLYLFPIMLASGFLPRWAIAVLGGICGFLAEKFSFVSVPFSTTRGLVFTIALCGCGLFFSEVIRNYKLGQTAKEQIQIFVETSPAAIVVVDETGTIESSNQAAAKLLAPEGPLSGQPISAFLPALHRALRSEEGPHFRTHMDCRGLRGNGESFFASAWFSTYSVGKHSKLAAIIADSSEEGNGSQGWASNLDDQARPPLNDRERDVLRFVCQGLANKEIASRMNISESAVKNVLQQLFAKGEVRTRGQLVRVALERYQDLL